MSVETSQAKRWAEKKKGIKNRKERRKEEKECTIKQWDNYKRYYTSNGNIRRRMRKRSKIII